MHVLIHMFLLVRRHSSTESSASDLIGSPVSAELCFHLNVQVGANKLSKLIHVVGRIYVFVAVGQGTLNFCCSSVAHISLRPSHYFALWASFSVVKEGKSLSQGTAYCCCSVTQSCLTLCDPMDYSIARLPCPSLSPRVCLNSCSLSWWYYLTISSSATSISFCLQLRKFSIRWKQLFCLRLNG